MSNGIVLVVVHDQPDNLNVLLTSVINSAKYFTPKEGVYFFFFLDLTQNLKKHTLVPISSLKLPKKPPDYYQFYYKSIVAGPNTKLHGSDDYLLFLSF